MYKAVVDSENINFAPLHHFMVITLFLPFYNCRWKLSLLPICCTNKCHKLSSSSFISNLGEGQFPCPRSYHAMASIGKSIFIFGGCGPEGNRLSDLHEFEVEKNLWISHGDGPMAGRGGAGLLAASNNKQVRYTGSCYSAARSRSYKTFFSSFFVLQC